MLASNDNGHRFFTTSEIAGYCGVSVRDVVRRLLEGLDADLAIEEARDGCDAGIKIGVLQPDLVVLEVDMPTIDGIFLCQSIRRNSRTEATRVLGDEATLG